MERLGTPMPVRMGRSMGCAGRSQESVRLRSVCAVSIIAEGRPGREVQG